MCLEEFVDCFFVGALNSQRSIFFGTPPDLERCKGPFVLGVSLKQFDSVEVKAGLSPV